MSSSGEVERVRRALLGRIVGGDWPPGVRLPAETDLASELDWRREGSPALLPYYLGVPAGLADAPRMLRELLRMRRLLAGEAVRLAARYGEAEGIAAVRRMLESSKQTTDPAQHALRELDVFRGLVVSVRRPWRVRDARLVRRADHLHVHDVSHRPQVP